MHIDREFVYPAAATACALIGAATDIKSRRIPNILTGPSLLAGLLLHLSLDGWHGLLSSFGAALFCGAVFLIFHLAGGMGAGDVKLMAAVGCFAGLSSLFTLMISTVIAGAVFALAVAIYNGRLRETLRNVGALLLHHGQQGLKSHPDLNLTSARALRLPFALPIAAGCLFSLGTLAWSVRP